MVILGKWKGHEGLFFVDYANKDYPVGAVVDGVIIAAVYDQFLHELFHIPEGFQTIVKFVGNIAELNKLPEMESWNVKA